jgi:alcohol dehydrogenase class IV
MRSPSMLPRVALVDPELTYSSPPAVTAATGLDVVTQRHRTLRLQPRPTHRRCCSPVRSPPPLSPPCARESSAQHQDMAFASLCAPVANARGLGAVHGFAGPFGGM